MEGDARTQRKNGGKVAHLKRFKDDLQCGLHFKQQRAMLLCCAAAPAHLCKSLRARGRRWREQSVCGCHQRGLRGGGR